MRLAPRMLLDGGVGTELMARGLDPKLEAPESWNQTRPDEVQAVYRAYFDAGADLVQTNSFGANRFRLSLFSRAHEVRALNVSAAVLAREVRPPGRLVVGDMGPTGALPPPEGTADLTELEDAYAEQAQALAEGGVDLLHVETQYHPKEARAALRGARLGAPGLGVIASMTCRVTPSGGFATPLGFSPEVMLGVFHEESVDAVGVNCTVGPAAMLELVRWMRARSQLPIVAQPTATPGPSEHVLPREMGAGAVALIHAGATVVGGCCGTTPADIAVMKQALASRPLQDLEF